MHEKELKALGSIEQWLHDEQFSYTSRHLINGGMLMLNFEKLDGFEFRVEFTVEEGICSVVSIFFAKVQEEKKKEVEEYLKKLSDKNAGLETEVDMNGNIIMKYAVSLSEHPVETSAEAEKLFWKSFGPARDSGTVLKKMMEKQQS